MLLTNVSQVVKVGIAQMDVVKAPDTIRTSGLGSCGGVVLYDESKQIAGLIHVMLPDSSLVRSLMRSLCRNEQAPWWHRILL